MLEAIQVYRLDDTHGHSLGAREDPLDEDSTLKCSILQSCLATCDTRLTTTTISETADSESSDSISSAFTKASSNIEAFGNSITTALLTHSAHTQNVAIQPSDSIVQKLPNAILSQIFEHVNQFDLISLQQTCSGIYPLAATRLYKRVTVILNPELPVRFKKDQRKYIGECGIQSMDSALILSVENLIKFLTSLHTNPKLIQRIKFFVFDKCFTNDSIDISFIQSKIIEFFGVNCKELNFLHITFVEFMTGIVKLTKFLKHENIRNRIFKLFVTRSKDLYEPNIPQNLSNLFLMMNEVELMSDESELNDEGELVPLKKSDFFDLSTYPFNALNSLSTLTCSTNNQVGLELLRSIKLIDEDYRLKLRGLSLFHCHRGTFTRTNSTMAVNSDLEEDRFLQFINTLDTKLCFGHLESKIDLTCLSHLFLKVDCEEGSHQNCKCFSQFFKDFENYSVRNHGLPNLVNFELESYPNLEWLRPHQILENILTPLRYFIGSLVSLKRLSIDFSTPGFKMFDSNMAMSSMLLNKLNERLMDAFFLTPRFNSKSITTLQLSDFLTSFIYYRTDFYESLLHTCQCQGCDLVLQRLKTMFYPIKDIDTNDDDNEAGAGAAGHDPDDPRIDGESAYYLIGYILGRLQADREVCIPIKDSICEYRNYPIYKGQPHTLHHGFHKEDENDESFSHAVSDKCDCDLSGDPYGLDELNIDNLVTTYVIHQLEPMVKYLRGVFEHLNNLMIHGVYYEYDTKLAKFTPIFDECEYPESLFGKTVLPAVPDVRFGYFKR